ncbi:MAG: response regulator [Anaerolineae bacterium]
MHLQKEIRVLVAEDDPLVSEMVQGILADLGYRVVGEAIDGQQVVELTQRLQPQVVVMDIEMPLVNGIEATQHISHTCPTPIVILTAYETPALLAQATVAGIGAYLIKPPKAQELDRAIAIAIARFNDLIELRRLNAELHARNEELQAMLAKVKTLSGLLPICAACKKIRDDHGYWQQVEVYLSQHTDVDFSHGLCPDCAHKLYPEFFEPR